MTPQQSRFLKCAFQAGLLCAVEKGAQWLQIDFLYHWSAKTWEFYNRAEHTQTMDPAAVVPASSREIREELAKMVVPNSADVSPAIQERVAEIVEQIPVSLRRAQSKDANLHVTSADELRHILPDVEMIQGRWNFKTMRKQLTEMGATSTELLALDAIFECGEAIGRCEFKASGTASFVIKIPTCGSEVNLLTLQGRLHRRLR